MRKYLYELRKRRGMSQLNVAEGIGISRQYYGLIENGERKQQMTVPLLCNLAKHFDVSTDFMINEEMKFIGQL